MFDISPTSLILYLQTLPPELMAIISLAFCYLTIIIMKKFFEAEGLIVYNVIAVIACNMQVLKATDFIGYCQPVALGTIVYASSFLASDCLSEFYSSAKARKSVAISFVASISLLIMMIIILGHKNISSDSIEHEHFRQGHHALSIIFTPNVAILFASLLAYGISQLVDIYIFAKLKKLTNNNKLWLRTFLSLSISSLSDTILFNSLAWKIFSPFPISWDNLISNYMVGGYIMQLIVALINIPFMYFIVKLSRKTSINKTQV